MVDLLNVEFREGADDDFGSGVRVGNRKLLRMHFRVDRVEAGEQFAKKVVRAFRHLAREVAEQLFGFLWRERLRLFNHFRRKGLVLGLEAARSRT